MMESPHALQTDPDRAAQEARLRALGEEYALYVEQTEHVAHDVDEHRLLLSQRSVVHDDIIAMFDALGLPYTDRYDVRRQVLQMVRRGWVRTPSAEAAAQCDPSRPSVDVPGGQS